MDDKPFFLQALDALNVGDRQRAAALIGRELREGNTATKNLEPISRLAAHIGEIELMIEAARRAVVPGSLGSLLAYWAVLATSGRSAEASADLERQPASVKQHPSVLHFRGTVETQFGRFDEAEDLFRRALKEAPKLTASWLSLAMIKTFRAGDPDIVAMEQLQRALTGSTEARTILDYALGKAREDCGDIDRAFALYSSGAALRQQQVPNEIEQLSAAADQVLRDHTFNNLAKLSQSGFKGQRSLFVTGLPRSGTTLTEQILRGHSAVCDGDEVNLFDAALIPTRGIGWGNVVAYEERSNRPDPWAEIGRDYARLIDLRFGAPGLVVDKSLGQSLLIGLILHSLPDARIAWLRRSPEDVALSCFKTYFSTGLQWTFSLADIADHMKIEDRLLKHWLAIFQERILVVPYEELVQAPRLWTERLQGHFALELESGIENRSKADRKIGSASVSQARQPISTSRIGRSAAFARHLKPFCDRYYS